MHGLEDPAPDRADSRLLVGHDRHPSDKERRVHHVEVKPSDVTLLKSLWNVRLLHEAVAHDDRMEIVAQMRNFDAPLGRDAGNVRSRNVQQDDPLVQYLVVL